MKGSLKLGAVLMLYATVACVGLAFVYQGTAAVIEQRTQADLEAALKELFSDADGFKEVASPQESPNPAVKFVNQYEVRKGGTLIGTAFRASATSYGGTLVSLVGVGSAGNISGVKILEISDTPGLGANASSPSYFVNRAEGTTFYGQFAGKSAAGNSTVTKDGGEVIAITAATITSRAVTSIVKAAGQAGVTWLGGNR